MSLIVAVSPGVITIPHYSILDPKSVGRATLIVNYDSVNADTTHVYFVLGNVPTGLNVSFSPGGGYVSRGTPMMSIMTITASDTCPYNTYQIGIIVIDDLYPPNEGSTLLTLVVTYEATHKVTIQVDGDGTTDPLPNVYQVDPTQVFTIRAYSNTGYTPFSYWTINGTVVQGVPGEPNRLDISGQTADIVVKAWFTVSYQITLQPIDGATWSAVAGGITYIAPTSFWINKGYVIALSATPDSNHIFERWVFNGVGGSGQADNYPYTPVANTTISVTLVLIPSGQAYLTIKKEGNGATNPAAGKSYPFTITSPPRVVSITATPNINEQFLGWTLDSVIGDNNPQLVVTMNANHVVTAKFTQNVGPPADNAIIYLVAIGVVGIIGIAILSSKSK